MHNKLLKYSDIPEIKDLQEAIGVPETGDIDDLTMKTLIEQVKESGFAESEYIEKKIKKEQPKDIDAFILDEAIDAILKEHYKCEMEKIAKFMSKCYDDKVKTGEIEIIEMDYDPEFHGSSKYQTVFEKGGKIYERGGKKVLRYEGGGTAVLTKEDFMNEARKSGIYSESELSRFDKKIPNGEVFTVNEKDGKRTFSTKSGTRVGINENISGFGRFLKETTGMGNTRGTLQADASAILGNIPLEFEQEKPKVEITETPEEKKYVKKVFNGVIVEVDQNGLSKDGKLQFLGGEWFELRDDGKFHQVKQEEKPVEETPKPSGGGTKRKPTIKQQEILKALDNNEEFAKGVEDIDGYNIGKVSDGLSGPITDSVYEYLQTLKGEDKNDFLKEKEELAQINEKLKSNKVSTLTNEYQTLLKRKEELEKSIGKPEENTTEDNNDLFTKAQTTLTQLNKKITELKRGKKQGGKVFYSEGGSIEKLESVRDKIQTAINKKSKQELVTALDEANNLLSTFQTNVNADPEQANVDIAYDVASIFLDFGTMINPEPFTSFGMSGLSEALQEMKSGDRTFLDRLTGYGGTALSALPIVGGVGKGAKAVIKTAELTKKLASLPLTKVGSIATILFGGVGGAKVLEEAYKGDFSVEKAGSDLLEFISNMKEDFTKEDAMLLGNIASSLISGTVNSKIYDRVKRLNRLKKAKKSNTTAGNKTEQTQTPPKDTATPKSEAAEPKQSKSVLDTLSEYGTSAKNYAKSMIGRLRGNNSVTLPKGKEQKLPVGESVSFPKVGEQVLPQGININLPKGVPLGKSPKSVKPGETNVKGYQLGMSNLQKSNFTPIEVKQIEKEIDILARKMLKQNPNLDPKKAMFEAFTTTRKKYGFKQGGTVLPYYKSGGMISKLKKKDTYLTGNMFNLFGDNPNNTLINPRTKQLYTEEELEELMKGKELEEEIEESEMNFNKEMIQPELNNIFSKNFYATDKPVPKAGENIDLSNKVDIKKIDPLTGKPIVEGLNETADQTGNDPTVQVDSKKTDNSLRLPTEARDRNAFDTAAQLAFNKRLRYRLPQFTSNYIPGVSLFNQAIQQAPSINSFTDGQMGQAVNQLKVLQANSDRLNTASIQQNTVENLKSRQLDQLSRNAAETDDFKNRTSTILNSLDEASIQDEKSRYDLKTGVAKDVLFNNIEDINQGMAMVDAAITNKYEDEKKRIKEDMISKLNEIYATTKEGSVERDLAIRKLNEEYESNKAELQRKIQAEGFKAQADMYRGGLERLFGGNKINLDSLNSIVDTKKQGGKISDSKFKLIELKETTKKEIAQLKESNKIIQNNIKIVNKKAEANEKRLYKILDKIAKI